jgi:CRISPR-associated protein Cmr6
MSSWKNYIKPNIGLLYYKRIYREKEIARIVDINKNNELEIVIPSADKTTPFDTFYNDLYQMTADNFEQIVNNAITAKFLLRTTYPGLLIGSGYQHETKAKGDFKIGFFFDHTTGQPVIPGSSVKGVLRSLFELDINDGKNFTGSKSVSAIKFICDEIIDSLKPVQEKAFWLNFKATIDETKLNEWKLAIWGDEEKAGSDIFFDAVINIAETGYKTKIFSNDFITPHHRNLLKNPIPIQFLKVLPNVCFEFRFKLEDTDNNLTIENKALLFKHIVISLGIGAKTNVGYGQFRIKNSENKDAISGEKLKYSINDELKEPSLEAERKMTTGSEWIGHIVFNKKDNFIIEIEVDNEKVRLKKKLDKFTGGEPALNKRVLVKFISNYKFGSVSFDASVDDN